MIISDLTRQTAVSIVYAYRRFFLPKIATITKISAAPRPAKNNKTSKTASRAFYPILFFKKTRDFATTT